MVGGCQPKETLWADAVDALLVQEQPAEFGGPGDRGAVRSSEDHRWAVAQVYRAVTRSRWGAPTPGKAVIWVEGC